MGTGNVELLSARLRDLLEFVRPKLVEGIVDTARLSKMRQMADMRIKAAAVRKPNLSLQEVCDFCCSKTNPTRFDLLARESGLLIPELMTVPVPVTSEVCGWITQCVLTFELMPSDRARGLSQEFLKENGSAPPPAVAPSAPAADPSKPKIIPQRIRLLLEKVTDLWSIPENTVKIQKMLGDPNSIAENIAAEVERDPGLSAHLLRVVNSAFYGLPGRVLSIRQAIVILGYQETKRLVMMSSLISKLNQANPEVQIDFKSFWSHSLWTAHAASSIVRLNGFGKPDDLFTAGLLHDIGKLIVYQYLTFGVKQIFSHVASGVPYVQAEERVLGTDHTVIGATICERWKFPNEVVESVRNHLQPIAAMESLKLSRESVLVAVLCATSKTTPAPEELARRCELMRIRPEQYDVVRAQATEQTLKSLKDIMVMGG